MFCVMCNDIMPRFLILFIQNRALYSRQNQDVPGQDLELIYLHSHHIMHTIYLQLQLLICSPAHQPLEVLLTYETGQKKFR